MKGFIEVERHDSILGSVLMLVNLNSVIRFEATYNSDGVSVGSKIIYFVRKAMNGYVETFTLLHDKFHDLMAKVKQATIL
ncbi:MAG: hypothetical protein FWE03_07340 [Firmicutes bacterium]|nr:hypothetical protein [Bacillota bacterium]